MAPIAFICGITGAGKTSFLKNLPFGERVNCLSLDPFVVQAGSVLSPFGKDRLFWKPQFWKFFGEHAEVDQAIALCLRRKSVAETLGDGRPIVVESGMLWYPEFREPFVAALNRLAIPIGKELYYLLIPPAEVVMMQLSERRLSGRSGRGNISFESIEAQRARQERKARESDRFQCFETPEELTAVLFRDLFE